MQVIPILYSIMKLHTKKMDLMKIVLNAFTIKAFKFSWLMVALASPSSVEKLFIITEIGHIIRIAGHMDLIRCQLRPLMRKVYYLNG